MLLTQKLLGYLNRVFNKNPDRFLALRFQYDGMGMQWSVADGVMAVTADGGVGSSFSVELSGYTLRDLADHIAGLPGFSVSYLSNGAAGLSALVLLDSDGDQSQSNGDHIYGYSSLLYAYLEAVSSELEAAKAQVDGLPSQMNIYNSDGTLGATNDWLDEVGGYFGVPRANGEMDQAYGPRIIAEVVRERGNNVALEIALETFSNQPATVTNAPINGYSIPLYNATYNYDGSQLYNSTGQKVYGLFDAAVAFDLVTGGDIRAFPGDVTAEIERLRSAGTHLRNLTVGTSAVSDAFANPSDNVSVVSTSYIVTDAVTDPADAFSAISIGAPLSDVSLPPTEAGDTLSVAYELVYAGTRFYDNRSQYSGGYLAASAIDGSGTVYSLIPPTIISESGDAVVSEADIDLILE